MDEVIVRIKEYVLELYPTIVDDLDISDDQLDFVVNSVVDRALIFMNRDQLVVDYEEDIEDYHDPQSDSLTEVEQDFWNNYDYPIPPRIERVLANVIIGASRTMFERITAETGAIKSVGDQGQSISYSDELVHYFNSSDESEVFSGSLELLRRYIIPSVVENYENTQ